MLITYNHRFRKLLSDFNMRDDFEFEVTIPAEVQQLLDDEIVVNEFGTTLKSLGNLYQAKESWQNQSKVENNENHFHVDWYVDEEDVKGAFQLGIKTILLLAAKFERQGIKGIRFHYSFQSPELARLWGIAHNMGDEAGEHYVSDRLSFHTRRKGEEMLTIDPEGHSYEALLTADI